MSQVAQNLEASVTIGILGVGIYVVYNLWQQVKTLSDLPGQAVDKINNTIQQSVVDEYIKEKEETGENPLKTVSGAVKVMAQAIPIPVATPLVIMGVNVVNALSEKPNSERNTMEGVPLMTSQGTVSSSVIQKIGNAIPLSESNPLKIFVSTVLETFGGSGTKSINSRW